METLVKNGSYCLNSIMQLPNLSAACGDGKLNESFAFICCRKRNAKLFAAATNGHILAEIEFSAFLNFSVCLEELPDEFFIAAKDFKKLATKIRRIDFDAENLIFKVFDQKHELSYIFQAIEKNDFRNKYGSYPDYLQVFPLDDLKKSAEKIGLNFQLVADLGEALIPSVKDRNRGFQFVFFGENKPAKVYPISPELSEICRGLIMPIVLF